MKNKIPEKRELVLDIKKDVISGEYEIRVIKQTHRGEEFTNSGDKFIHNGFVIQSCNVPSIYILGKKLYICGSRQYEDNTVLKTSDSVYVDELISAVNAYNKEFCGVDTNLELAKDSYKQELIEFINEFEKLRYWLNKATTREEFMDWKRKIMLHRVNIKTECGSCFYCRDMGFVEDFSSCCGCEYGKKNGICRYDGSLITEIHAKKRDLIEAIERY